ncbi:hypothetical protein I547_6024 [Mycobacterium kansasii 824]|nr:hypothetical protein I547_6024 [Mycobacterium kansasii 824]
MCFDGVQCALTAPSVLRRRPVCADGAECASTASGVLRRRRMCRQGGQIVIFPPYEHAQSPHRTLDVAATTVDPVSTRVWGIRGWHQGSRNGYRTTPQVRQPSRYSPVREP